MDSAIRNPDFAAKLALTYAELFDGISPTKQRVSLRVRDAGLELKNVETQHVSHWPLADIRTVPDLADTSAMVFAPNDTHDARLIIREAEALRVLAASDAPLTPMRGPAGQGRRLGLLASLAVACYGAIFFGLMPLMAGQIAQAIPPETEIAIGEMLFEEVYLTGGSPQCVSPEGQAALDGMTQRLAEGADLHLPLTVRVVQNGEVNATALPGGQITFHSALIEAAESPDEVAAVLAHEIGHVAHRDGTEATLRAMGTYGMIGLLFGDFLGSAAVAGAAQSAVDSAYSRSAEERADAYAHERLAAVGVPPVALANFFRRLQERPDYVEPMGVFAYLSTHPETLDRIEAAEAAEFGAAPRQRLLSEAEWQALRDICSAVTVAPGSPGGGSADMPPGAITPPPPGGKT